MSAPLTSTTIDDGNPNITYVPAGEWTIHTSTANVNSTFHLFNNTDTFSSVQDATATLLFYGDAIEYWGNQGPFHGPCAISLDGQAMTTANSNAPADDVPILLYSQNNLTLGDHSLEIRVVAPSFPNVCEVDRFVVNVTTPTAPTSSLPTLASTNGFVTQSTSAVMKSTNSTVVIPQPTIGGGSTSANNEPHMGRKGVVPLAAIVGAVVGAALVCIILLVIWIFRRSRKRVVKRRDMTISKPFVIPDMDEPFSPAPETPSFYQTSEYNRTSHTASPVDQPSFTYYQAERLPAKLMTRPRPNAFNNTHPDFASSASSSPYPQSPSSFDFPSPISEDLEVESGVATISPTSAKLDSESQRSPPKRNLQRVYAINNRGSSSVATERYSDKSATARQDVPPPAYDG